MSSDKRWKIVFNSPVILTFSALCILAFVLSKLTGGLTDRLLFSVYHSSLSNIFTYFRFVGHIFGHASISHISGNLTMILVLGPLLEEKYGRSDMIFTILATAIVTGLVNFILFPNVALMGASGVVFAFILLASMTQFKSREIPVTLILVAFIYLGGQIIDGIFVNDNVSQLTHIVGGIVGASVGFIFPGRKKA